MADLDTRYRSNGAAAYNVYAFSGYEQTAQPLERPQGLPEERPQRRQQTRVKAKTQVAPFALIGMMAAACMMVLVIFGYVQLFEATSRVSKLQSQYQSLQEELAVLTSKYEGKLDLTRIQERAGELGLRTATPEQTVYVNLSGADRAVIYHETKTSLAKEVVEAVQHSISELIAYLHPAAA